MCGIFGIYGHRNASWLTYLALFALQHRGQESAGIAASDGRKVRVEKGMGLVSNVFSKEKLEELPGDSAVGHVRYSTRGGSSLRNAQPFYVEPFGSRIAIVDNGDVVNIVEQWKFLQERGVEFYSGNDAELKIKAISYYYQKKFFQNKKLDIIAAIKEMMRYVKGAYSTILLSRDQMIVFRDPFGIRPLSVGRLEHAWVFASETCAFDAIGAEFIREIDPGEIVVVDKNGMRSVEEIKCSKNSLCVFEFIYFARPDSIIYGKLLQLARKRMGIQLFSEYPIQADQADLVIPIPDTGIPSALGYAEASGIPYNVGLIRNRYIWRTFIEPEQEIRNLDVSLKLNPMPAILKGKRIVLTEDSIVRGTTTRQIVSALRNAGAREIHLLISSPPYRYPCFYGIDTGRKSELIAASMSVEDIRKFVGADTLGYLSLEELFKAIGLPQNMFCTACFNGDYPIAIPDNPPDKLEVDFESV